MRVSIDDKANGALTVYTVHSGEKQEIQGREEEDRFDLTKFPATHGVWETKALVN